MTAEQKYREATRRAEANKAAFLANLAEMKARVQPARLKADAVAKAQSSAARTRDRTVETVREHPFAIAGGIAAIIAYLFRKPALRWFRIRRATHHPGAVAVEESKRAASCFAGMWRRLIRIAILNLPTLLRRAL